MKWFNYKLLAAFLMVSLNGWAGTGATPTDTLWQKADFWLYTHDGDSVWVDSIGSLSSADEARKTYLSKKADSTRLDSIAIDDVKEKILLTEEEKEEVLSRYDRHLQRAYKAWNSLIPSQLILQRAGNMGYLSLGLGWSYGRQKQWETHLLWGWIPKHDSSETKTTMTVKQTFLPWRWHLGKQWMVEPLSTGLYFNTVFGHEFWGSQPERYPDSYYDFLSTKVRANVFLGQRITYNIPHEKRHKARAITFFWEVSSCDLYIRAYVTEKRISLNDILCLSVGLKFNLL